MKDKFINILLTLIIVACFGGAGYMGYLLLSEAKTTGDSQKESEDLRQAVVQVLPTATAWGQGDKATATPSAGETLLTALPYAETPARVTAAPTAEEEDSEPESETIDDNDEQLLWLLYRQRSGEDVLATPPVTDAPAETPSAEPSEPAGNATPIPTPFATATPGVVVPTVTAGGSEITEPPETLPSETPSGVLITAGKTEPVPQETPEKGVAITSPVDLTESPVGTTEGIPEGTPEPTADTVHQDTQTVVPTETAPAVETPEVCENTETPVPTATPYTPQVGHSIESTLRLSVDFGALERINADTKAYLYQEGTEIDYPVVQGTDNEYYLTHLFSGTQNKVGSLFMDCNNSGYFIDMITFIYGHNRKDGQMFASIPSYMEQEYYEAHPTMELLTPYENYQVEIFAMVRLSTDDKDDWHVKYLKDRDTFETYTQGIIERSYIDTGVVPEWGDQLLVLSTCTNEVR